jgi:glycine oxidase
VVIGSTMEEAGFDKTVHPTTIGQLRASAERLVPKLTEFETVETWTGLRPATPDGRPLIGPTSLRGYFLAVGHLRNGILLAPITAKLLAPVILGAAPEPLLAPFLPKVG